MATAADRKELKKDSHNFYFSSVQTPHTLLNYYYYYYNITKLLVLLHF